MKQDVSDQLVRVMLPTLSGMIPDNRSHLLQRDSLKSGPCFHGITRKAEDRLSGHVGFKDVSGPSEAMKAL